MIKAVIFDIDGVLLDSFEANFKFFSLLLKKYGFAPPTREAMKKLAHMIMYNLIQSATKIHSKKELKKIWQAAKEGEYPHDLLHMPKQLYETIDELSQKYTLAIVTSRVRASIFGMPQLQPLQKYFKTVVAYEDTDDHKPHPAPLILCSENLKLPPEECVYIGDTEADVTAAHQAGMKAILYSKEKSKNAEAVTNIFTDIPGLVEQF